MKSHQTNPGPKDSLRIATDWSRSLGVTLCLLVAAAVAGCKKKEEAAPQGTQQPDVPSLPPTEMTAKWPVGKRMVRHVEFTQEITSQVEGSAQPAPRPERGKKGKGGPGETGQAVSQSAGATTSRTQDVGISVIKSRDGGGVELEVELLGEKLESKSAGRTLATFDSTADPKTDRTNIIAGPLRKLIGTKIKMQTDASGKVEAVEELPALFKKVTAGASAQAQAVARTLMAEPVLKELAPLAFGLPNKTVSTNDTWTSTLDIPLAGTSLQVSLSFTFKNVEERGGKKLALVEYTGTAGTVANPQSGAFTIEIVKSSLTGQLWFDPSLGLDVEQSSESQITMKINSARGSNTSDSTQKTLWKLVEITDIGKGDAKAADSKAGDEKKSQDSKPGDVKATSSTSSESKSAPAAKQP